MGLFSRLHRITVARIEAFLDRVEDPEVLFPQLIREMEGQLNEATEAEAKALAAVKGAQRDLDAAEEKAGKLGKGARLALGENDEQTAREALEAQLDAEKAAEAARETLDLAGKTRDHATAARKRVQQQLEELRAKKDEILTRARVAKTRQKIQGTVSGSSGSADSILDAVARLEAAVEEDEAELEVQASLTGEAHASPSLEKRLGDLERSSEIDRRLEQLRAEVQGSGPQD